eukprot:gene11608-12810_t
MPSLLLQKPSKTSKSKDHVEKLRKRLDLWKSGNFDDLVREARFIQSRFSKHKPMDSIDKVVINGKINAALKLLSDTQSSGILQLDDSTLQLPKKKHPDGEDKFEDLLLQGPELSFGEYTYESNPNAILKRDIPNKRPFHNVSEKHYSAYLGARSSEKTRQQEGAPKIRPRTLGHVIADEWARKQ